MPWRDRFYEFVTTRIARRSFRAWAARSVFLSPFARASAGTLFDLCAGFTYTQTLLACCRLDVFARVHERPRTPGEMARLTGLSTQAAELLMRAAASLDLLRARADGTYGLGLQGAALIENPGVLAMIEHNALLYRDLSDPVAALRQARPTGELARFWGYTADGHDALLASKTTDAYSQLMAVSQEMVADEVLDVISFADARRLLDVGGGHGAFACAVARRWPHLSVGVFDLPAVAQAAAAAARAAGVEDFLACEGDFVTDQLPEGADVISLVRVLHDHDDTVVLRLLERVRCALPANGTVVIAEPMRAKRGAAARAMDAYFGFYLRGMGRGRIRSVDEIASLMQRAGFVECRAKRTKVPLIASVLVGKCAK